MKTRRESVQENSKVVAAGRPAASTAPAKHQFVGTNPTKRTSGPSLSGRNVGPEGAPYYNVAGKK